MSGFRIDLKYKMIHLGSHDLCWDKRGNGRACQEDGKQFDEWVERNKRGSINTFIGNKHAGI